MGGEQLLEVLLDAVLLQAGVDAEVVRGVVRTSSMRMRRVSSGRVLPWTSPLVRPSSLVPSRSLHGGDIQLSGL